MKLLQLLMSGAFFLAVSGMALLNHQGEDVRKKEEVRQRLDRMARNPHGGIFDTEEQKAGKLKFLRDNADIVITIGREESEKLLSSTTVSTGYSGPLGSCLWWAIEADREKGLAFNLDLFKKIQLALMIIEPHFNDKPKETRDLLGPEDSRYVAGLIHLRGTIVNRLRDAKSNLLVEHVKPLIESEWGVALQYLILFVEQDKDLKEFLKRKSRDPKSKAYNDPLLKNLDEMEE